MLPFKARPNETIPPNELTCEVSALLNLVERFRSVRILVFVW